VGDAWTRPFANTKTTAQAGASLKNRTKLDGLKSKKKDNSNPKRTPEYKINWRYRSEMNHGEGDANSISQNAIAIAPKRLPDARWLQREPENTALIANFTKTKLKKISGTYSSLLG